MGSLENNILKGVKEGKKLKKVIQIAVDSAKNNRVSDDEEEELRSEAPANRSRAGIGFSNYSSPEYLAELKKKKDEEELADPLGLRTMPNSNAAGPQDRTDIAKAKQEHDERLAREARILAANQLMQQEGWAKVGNEEAVYKTPFSPLPDPDKKYTLPDGKQVSARGNKALAPGLYGINPDEYVHAMTAFDKYSEKPELSAESKAFLQKYFPEKNGQVPTREEIEARAAGMTTMDELSEYAYDSGVMLKDHENVQKALKAYQPHSNMLDSASMTEDARNYVKDYFPELYAEGKVPTYDDVLSASQRLGGMEGVDLMNRYYTFAPKFAEALMQDSGSGEVYDAYTDAIKLLGVDAEQYAGQDAGAYYERYGNLYGAEHDSKGNPYYEAEGPLKLTQEQAEAWAMRPISHTTQDEQFDLVRWGVMTQEEKDAYNTILRNYGEEAAKNYLQAKEGELNQRVTQKEQLENGQLAMKHPFLAAVAAPIESVKASGAQADLWLEELVTGQAPDEYDLRRLNTRFMSSDVANAGLQFENKIDAALKKEDSFLGNAVRYAYQNIVAPLANMGANMLVFGPAANVGMGLSAASSMYNDVIDRGGDHNTANAMAGVAGISEMLFEKFSIEGVWDIAKGGGLGKAVLNVMRQMGVEASEETATEIANQIGDYLLMGDLSTFKQEGAGTVAKEIAMATVGGALMGGVSGGTAQGVHAVRSHIANSKEDQLIKKAAEARAEQQIAEQEAQGMLDNLPADMPVQEAAVPENVEVQKTAAQEAEQRNQEAQQQEQMHAEQAAQQNARKQALEQKNADYDAEMRGKATQNASKGAQTDEARKTQDERKRAADEAEKRKKQLMLEKQQGAVLTSREGTNESVTVTGVDHVENGTVYVTVEDANGVERVESADEMSFSGETGELLSSDNIDRLDERGVTAYLDNYDPELAGVKEYERAFVGVYERARAGMNYRDAVTNSRLAQTYLTQEAASQAFLAGTARYNTDQASKQQKRQKFQDPVLNAMNKMAGGKIFMVDSLPGNAMYEKDTGNIYIAKDAEKGAYAYYAMHELVHKLKHESSDYWGKFREMVEDELLMHDVDIDAEMAHVMENYKAQGKALDSEGALEEVIANHVPALLQDRAVLEKMVAQDRSLMEKIREWFEGFMDKLHNAMVESGEVMSGLQSWHNIDMLKGDSAQLMKMYDCLVEALDSAKGEQKAGQDVKLSAREKEHYDYSKPFAEQVEDLREGRFPERRALLVSGTPEVLQKIGFSKLPLMINQDHLLRMERDTEHTLSKEMIRQLPELMKDPIAVIGSEGNSDSSIVMILKAIVNGKPYIAPVYITSESHANSARIDSNNIATVFRKGNAVSKLLENAVQKENADKIGVYYWKKTEARDLFEGAGVQFSGSSIQDGLVHSIYDAGSPVNREYMEQTETKQFDRWFKGSKVVNADGTPKVMYRGGGEDIEVFDRKKSKSSNLYGRGFYFTDSETHAKQYGEARSYYLHIANPLDAESGAKNITPKQMRAFLEAVAEDEDYGLENYGYGASVDSVLKGLKGKSDFDALQDINATAIGDFVAAIELFNKVNGTSYDGIITPTETVVFDSKQIKSATDNVGLFDPDNPNVKFSLREPVEETRDLLAVHNLTEENMRSALELGGLAMPSIAVIKAKQGHSMYGPISAIFDKSTIDPKASSANEIYGGDAWTPTFPQVEYEVADEVEKRISDKYYDISQKYGNNVARPLYAFATDLENTVNRSGGVERIIEKLKGDTSVMQAYLADSGQQMVEPVVKTTVKRMPASQIAMHDSMIKKLGEETMRSFETPKGESPINYRRAWMDEHGDAVKKAYTETLMEELALDEKIASEAAKDTRAMKRALLDAYLYMKNGPETREEVTDYEATDDAIRAAVDSKAYEEWLNGLFAGAVKGKGIRNDKSLFTPSGNRRSFAATHWDVTLDNVVRSMRSEEKTGVGSLGGRNIEGAAVKKYGSIKDVKADSDRLKTIDQDEYEAMRKGFRDRFSALARDYAGDGDWFDAGDVLVEAVTKYQTADGIYKYISKYADLYKPSKKIADDLHALVEEMKNAPTGYFEAKPRRAIGFDEVAAVIVPDNLSDDVRTALADAGANMIEYEAGNEEDRLAKMNGEAVSNLKFSLRESDTTVQDELTTLKDLFHLTSAHRMTDKEAIRMARKVKAAAQSTMDNEELAGKLKHIYDYVERGGKNASMEEVDSELNALAEEILATSRTLDYEHEERVKPIRDYLRRKAIKLTDEQRKEAAGLVGNVGTYRRMLFGKVRLSNEGTPLDTLWGELTDMDAELFPADAGESEMAALLLDAVDAIAPVYVNDSGLNSMEAAQWLTGEMNKAYLSLSGVQAAAKESNQLAISLKQYRKLTERFANEHKAVFDEAMVKVKADMDEEKRKHLEEAEKQYRLDVLNAKADARAEYKEEIAQVKANADAKIAKMKDKLGEAKAKYRAKQKEKYKDWRKEYRTAQSEKYKEFRQAYRDAMQKKDKEWRVQYREDRKETERKQRYRGQITRMMNELVKLLEHPTDKKHVQDGLKDAVLEFCRSIDLGSSNKATLSLQSRITSLVKAMEDAQKGTEAGNNQYLIDPDLLDTMKEFAEKVKTLGSMNELTADQMREMRNMVRGVAHIVKTADWMFVANRKMRISDAAMSTMDELSRKKDKKKREGFLGKLDELMNNGMLDSFRAFDRFGTTARKMYQNLRDGFDVKVRSIAQAMDFVQEHLEGADKDIVKGKKSKKTTYQVRGGEIELTKAQVMELYCLSKRKAARKHLYNGGISTDDHVSMVRVTEADVQNIISTLTDGERKLAEALQMFLETECSKWGNETSMTLHGYRKFGEKGYYPMRVDDGSIDTKVTESGQSENLWAMVNPGFGKELSDKANQALRIGDIFDTFSRHVDSMSSYRAYAAPIADLLRWYNWKPYGEQGIKTMLTQKFGVNGREYIPNLIRDLNMQTKAGYSPGIAEGFTKHAKAAAVGMNVRVVIQQPTAIARAAALMNPKYLAQAMTLKRMQECGRLAKEYCPIAKWKSMGYYETHMGKGLRDLMFGGQGALEKASDWGMKPAGWADEMTWAALWNACEKESRDMHPELSGKALYEATGKRLAEIIDYTQVVDTPFHRSQLMRSKNTAAQMATAFMSEPTKTWNMLQAAIARWAENRRDPVARAQVGRTLLVFVATGVLNAAAQSVIDAMRDDDDEEELLEKYMQAFGGNVLDNLNAIALLPYASDIISMMQGFEPSRMDMQMVQKVIELGKQLFDGKPSDWSAHRWARKVLSAVSYATGVPLENLYRDVTSLYNTVMMQFGGKPLPSQHQTANEKMAYGNLYDALLDGNQKKWGRIEGTVKAWEKPKSNSDIDTGIGKLLAEDDERIAKAWEAKSAGKASEVSRIRQEMVNELAKSGVLGTERLGEIVDKAINTYGNKVTPKEEKPVDTEKPLKVKMYTTKDAVNAVRGIADGTTSLADAKAIISELVADSEAKDPQKSVRSDVLSEVKKDYLEAVKSGDKGKASKLGSAMTEVLGTTQKEMDKWLTDSYADDLRTAVDASNTGNAKNIMAKLRARGLDDYDIQDRLSKYRQQYIDAVKSGDRAKANQIKRTLMSLGLKYKDGKPMYKDSTFEGWLK